MIKKTVMQECIKLEQGKYAVLLHIDNTTKKAVLKTTDGSAFWFENNMKNASSNWVEIGKLITEAGKVLKDYE